MIETHHQDQPARGRRRKSRTLATKPTSWKPEPTGLSRDELRRIVLKALG